MLLQCCMLCHIVVQVILMLVSVCVSFFLFMLVPSVVNLGMALDSVAFVLCYKCYCWIRVCRFHFKMFVLVVSIFVFGVVGVVGVVVPSLLSLSIVYSYLLVTGTVFFKQIQVCNAG